VTAECKMAVFVAVSGKQKTNVHLAAHEKMMWQPVSRHGVVYLALLCTVTFTIVITNAETRN